MPFKKGYIPWNKGTTLSQEIKEKVSIGTKRAYSTGKRKKNPSQLGENSPSWKGGKPLCIYCGERNKSWNVKAHKQCYMQYRDRNALRRGGLNSRRVLSLGSPTNLEKKLYDTLKNKGLRFEKQYLVNGKFLVDAYIPSLNLIIEADGKYWHELEHIKKKDKAENAYLIKCGYKLLRLSETEINTGGFGERIN